MKTIKTLCIAILCAAVLFGESSCGITNTGKGALIGTGGGGAVGAGIGALIGKATGKGTGKGAAIGAAAGAAVGAGVGVLIGNKMDKQKKQLEEQLANQAAIESTTDVNGYQAIKVTFEGGILFPTNGTTLNDKAKTSLTNFAASLKSNPDTNVQVFGFTDNTGKLDVNQRVSTQRAEAVRTHLLNAGVAASRLSAEGLPMTNYIATNETAEGRAQNRRVEVYISANEDMIQKAEAGTLQ